MAISRLPQPSRCGNLVDIEHVGPGTPAGNWLRLFWHPVYVAEELPVGRAMPLRILGEDFTLYRGESGAVHAVAFRCAHRGTQLSTGWVEDDKLRCFYHGWAYDGNGQCVEQPAEPEPFCSRIRIRSFPVEEYIGLIFAYFGEGDPPPLPRYAVAEQSTLYQAETTIWPFSYRQALDNKQDMTHLPFVHQRTRESAAGRLTPVSELKFPTIRVEETAWGFTSWATYPSGMTTVEHILMPNVYLHKDAGNRPWDPPSGWDDMFRWTVPIDDETHLDVRLNLGHATPDVAEEYRRQRREILASTPEAPVLEYVKAVLEGRMTPAELATHDMHGASGSLVDAAARWGQGTIPDRTQDHLGQGDVAPILYRKIYEREIQALADEAPVKHWHWPIDLHATMTKSSDTLQRGPGK